MSEIVTDIRPVAAVAVSLLGTILIVASHRRPNLREAWTVLVSVGKFAIVASMFPAVLAGTTFSYSLGSVLPGIEFVLRADPLGLLFATLASLLWIVTSFYSIGYMRGLDEDNQTRFFAAFAASLSATMGIAFAGNLVTIFIFYELLSLATYPLVAHDETDRARAAGRKYLAYTFFGGGVLVLAGTVLVYWIAGTTDFTAGGIEALAAADPTIAQITFIVLAIGFGVKAGLMPLHQWLPEAMVAPTPVSGLLHAVAVVKSGAFGVARVVLDVFGPEVLYQLGMGLVISTIAAITLTAASFIAIRKDHLKQRLAYSTVSQLSYIVLGLGLFGWYGLIGALLHIPAHAFMKLTLFFCAGAIHVETHTDHISKMAGIGKRMPVTLGAFTIAAAGMAGTPLLAGFVSKYYMLIGGVQMGATLTPVAYYLVGALLLSGVLNIVYFWPVVYTAFFEAEDAHDAKPLVDFQLGGEKRSLLASADGGSGRSNRPRTDGGVPDDDRQDADDLEDADKTQDVADDGADDPFEPKELIDDAEPERPPVDSEQGEDDIDEGPTGVIQPDFAPGDGRFEYDDSEFDDSDVAARLHPSDHVAENENETDAQADRTDQVSDSSTDDDTHDVSAHDDEGTHDHHHEGPPPGGWRHITGREVLVGSETTWFMLGPILAAVTGAIALGVVPYGIGFLELIEVIVEGVGVSPP
ncbi:cation:proton antiporter [Halalkalirubrum salinum]|uniref:cation:proton antiporter n=1 Tax=Halalkalirubrum salinum TaxID=2563889 RepID=UPI0010FAD110|nr:cation:proton antiporter [Halalkalirubrum salinum]